MSVKGIIIRAIIVLLSFIGMNKLYSLFYYESDLQKFAPIINEIRAIPQSAKVLYIGESSNITSYKNDTDKRPISALMGRHYPEGFITHLTQPAGHLGIFHSMLEAIDPNSNIETIVLTVNLRSFNAEWKYSPLESNLQKSAILLRNGPPLYKRFLLSFKSYPNESDAILERLIHADWRANELDVSAEFPHKYMLDWREAFNRENSSNSLGSEFITTYAFSINEHHERFHELDKIIELAEVRGWNLLVHILPENFEAARENVGRELTDLMDKNVSVITDYLTRRKIPFVSLHRTLPDDYFMDKEWPTEHYVYEGRKVIADQLAASLSRRYSNVYIENPQEAKTSFLFKNDCEGTEYWANMHTITFDDARSGLRSSKTGLKDEYSINFEQLYTSIPNDRKNKVKIDLFCKSDHYSDKMLLVLDAFLSNGERIWKGEPITKLSIQNSDWNHISKEWELGEAYQKCKRINVYVYNPTKRTLLVDDVTIEFN